MSMSFKLRNADFIPLPKSTVSKPVSSFFASLPIITEPRSFTDIWCFFYLNLFLSLFINLFLGLLGFFSGNFAPKILHHPPQLLVFDLARNVPTKLWHSFICKSVMSFEPVAVSANFSSVYASQHVHVVRSVFYPYMFF